MMKRAVHPGVVLLGEIEELGIEPDFLARQLEISMTELNKVVSGKKNITADIALRLGHWFETEPMFWLNLQTQFDLARAERRVGNAIRQLPTRPLNGPETLR